MRDLISPTPIPFKAAAPLSLCVLAVTLPTDYVVGFILGAGESFRAPSVYAGFAALIFSLPVLPDVLGMGRRLLSILLLFASFAVGALILIVLMALGDVRWAPGEYGFEQPFKLALMSVLVAFSATQGQWHRRLVSCYLVGWAIFVAYGVYAAATGTFHVFELNAMNAPDIARYSIAGLNENEQSTLAATGIVLLVAEIASMRHLRWVPIYLVGILGGFAVFVLGGSRSASLALGAGLLTVAAAWIRGGSVEFPRRVAPIALVIAGLAVGATVVVEKSELVRGSVTMLEHRFGEAVTGENRGNRDSLASTAVRVTSQNPIHGVGLGRVRDFIGDDPHNGYLKVVAEGGVLAGLLLLGALVLISAAIAREARIGPGLGPAAVLVVLLVAATAGQDLVQMKLWFFLGMVAAGSDAVEGP